jgi:pre-mRNA-splicing factor CWC22
MGLPALLARLTDPAAVLTIDGPNGAIIRGVFDGLFPKDNPRNTRFAVNYFTSIGLGGLTEELREWLKNAPVVEAPVDVESESSESSSSDSSSDSSRSEDESKQGVKRDATASLSHV